MDANAISNLQSVMKATETSNAVQIEVMRKTMALQKEHAAGLLKAVPNPPPTPSRNPPNLGQSIDVHV